MKNRLSWLLFVLTLLTLQSCYLLKQGAGQIRLRLAQVPLEEAIASEQNQDYKKLLAAVPGIKRYAHDYLELKQNDNYTGYFHTAEEGITFVVTASPKTRLEPYTWWFPLIGSVPYKGFFDRSDAQELENRLKENGFDTWLFAAPAYSTLGWFKDPLTTPMLKRGYYTLVSTLIHEMVHSTLYVEGEGDFNEQLASFVEEKGTLQYFRQYGLLNENHLSDLHIRKSKRKAFMGIVEKYLATLNHLYASNMDKQEMLNQRQLIFGELKDEALRLYPGKGEGYWQFNNARLLQYRRYREDSKLLNEMWQQSNQNWKRFWKLVRDYVARQGWEN